jgi:hypothetical protein
METLMQPRTLEDLAAEFERRAQAADKQPVGGFMLTVSYREQMRTEARVWREAAALARKAM